MKEIDIRLVLEHRGVILMLFAWGKLHRGNGKQKELNREERKGKMV